MSADLPKASMAATQPSRGRDTANRDIAIVGMSCRFPGARNVDEFWENLLAGRESISFLSEEELGSHVPAELRQDPRYVRAAGLIEEPFGFDAGFFGISPMEARIMDPQHRVLMEASWHALEHAGEAGGERFGRASIFAGVEDNTYYKSEIAAFPEAERKAGNFWVSTGNEKDYVAMKVAYKLNLRGPAISVHTACSTSLVATIMACKSLREGESDLALAGGATVHFPTPEGYYFQEGGIFSSDGHCRPFDKDADGTLFTDGVAVVVLKRLGDALRDGNTIYAVIKGGGINNDGSDRMSFSFPSIAGQADCIRTALEDSAVDAGTIQYVEAHGTATPIGDPIELDGLRQAYASRSNAEEMQYCGIGSVKSNIGHTSAAAGAAGLIKSALALHHGVIPPTVNYRSPNPKLRLEESPFYIVDRRVDWPRGEALRRAAVSSFGIGGTNSHVILEEAPQVGEVNPVVVSLPFEVWPVSAKSASQRDTLLESLAAENLSARDVAYTLQNCRGVYRYRGALVRIPESTDEFKVLPARPAVESPPIAMMFPGQGSQYIEMGRGLHEAIPEFRKTFDYCCDVLGGHLGIDFRAFLFDRGNATALENTRFTQPALFAIEASLGRLLMDWGIRPKEMIGHSVGEFVAAYLAGVFSLEDALRLVATRGQMMSELPRGRMISVRGGLEMVLEAVGETVDVAAMNSPNHCVISGPDEQMDRILGRLQAKEIPCRPLHTSHAFHSGMMEPAVAPFEQMVRSITLRPPGTPIISTVTGKYLTDSEATDPLYWATQLRRTVSFSPALFRSIDEGTRIFLEVGPRTVLSSLAAQHFTARGQAGAECTAISLLGDKAEAGGEVGAVGVTIARAWCAGVKVPWEGIWPQGKRVPLRSIYPFKRKDYRFSEGLAPETAVRSNIPAKVVTVRSAQPPHSAVPVQEVAPVRQSANELLTRELAALCSQLAGISIDTPEATFVEIGLDSLVLMQLGMELGKRYGVSVNLGELLGNQNSLQSLARHVAKEARPERLAHLGPAPDDPIAPAPHVPAAPGSNAKSLDEEAARMLWRRLAAIRDTVRQQLSELGAPYAPGSKQSTDRKA